MALTVSIDGIPLKGALISTTDLNMSGLITAACAATIEPKSCPTRQSIDFLSNEYTNEIMSVIKLDISYSEISPS